MAWKNGGGVTTEICTFPQGACIEDFDWRLSMALVDADGPFSQFPGIDRTLAILDGAGIGLQVDGSAPANLTIETPPYPFPADRPAHARLFGGPTHDLNMMTRRGAVHHQMHYMTLIGQVDLVLSAPTTLIFCQDGPAKISTGRDQAHLHNHDCAQIETVNLRLEATDPARLYLIYLQ